MAEGFEPSTASLEGRCSIQLSYATILAIKFLIYFTAKNLNTSGKVKLYFPLNEKTELLRPVFVGVAGFEPAASCSQSRRDNRATLHPVNSLIVLFTVFKYGVLTHICGETGTRTLATVTRRQISNLLRYHSGTSPNYLYERVML